MVAIELADSIGSLEVKNAIAGVADTCNEPVRSLSHEY